MAVSIQPSVVANLEEMITCVICTLRLQEPKHLHCQHAFCAHCLKEWMDSPSNLDKHILPCPSCRQLTELPPGGVDSLPADFNKNVLLEMLSLPSATAEEDMTMKGDPRKCSTCQIQGTSEIAMAYCNNCEEHLCTTCLANHNSESALQSHSVIFGLPDELTATGYVCDVHNGKKLVYFCPQCLDLICGICVRTGHLGHGALTIDEAANDKKDALRDVILLIEQMHKSIDRACPFKEKHQVDDMFESLREEMRVHSLNAKRSIDKWLVQASTDLEKRKDILQIKLQKKCEYMTLLRSLQLFYEERLEDPDKRSFLLSFDELLSRAGLLLNQQDDAFNIPRWRFVPVLWPLRLGYLEKKDFIISKSVADGTMSPKKIEVQREEAVAMVEADAEVEAVAMVEAEAGAEVEAVVELAAEAEAVAVPVVECNNGAHCVAVVRGDFTGRQLPVKRMCWSEDHHTGPGESWLPGNAVMCGKQTNHSMKMWIDTSSDDDGIITHISDVIVGPADWMIVADASRGCVQRIWLNDLGRAPETILEDVTPRRIALSSDGSIAITDQGFIHMLAVNRDNTISARPKWTPLEMVQPFAVGFVEHTQQILLTDMHNLNVVVYDENLRFLWSFGGPDTFKSPNCVWCDDKGRVLVSDPIRNNVNVFSLTGDFLWIIDRLEPAVPIQGPTAVCGDEHGVIYVGCLDGRIGAYDTDGRFIYHLTDEFEEITNVSSISCRTESKMTLVAVVGSTPSDQSMVRLWQLPNPS